MLSTRCSAASFHAEQADAVRGIEVRADVLASGLAYRAWALAKPALFAVMFGGRSAGIEIDARVEQSCVATIAPLAGVVRRGKAQKLWRRGTEEQITMSLWASVHGLVGVELVNPNGLPHSAWEKICRLHLGAVYRGWLADPS